MEALAFLILNHNDACNLQDRDRAKVDGGTGGERSPTSTSGNKTKERVRILNAYLRKEVKMGITHSFFYCFQTD